MHSLPILLSIGLLTSWALTRGAIALAPRIGLVDQPDGRRKMHGGATPVAGGIAVFLSLSLTLTIACFFIEPFDGALLADWQSLVGLLLAGAVICLVGIADDYHCLRGRHKLVGQLLAIAVVIAFGLDVRHICIFGWEVELGLLAIPFTVFWLLGAINSLNLLDGMDGFLSSIGLIIALAMAAMSILGEKWMAACIAVSLAGALLGFLRYNFPPASIFLGDAGSMVIGLVVGVLALQGSLKGPATIALAAPLAIMTIPMLDTTAAIIRRKLTGRSLYSTDRGHLHHCLQRRGLSRARVLGYVSILCLLTVCGALGSLAVHNELWAVLAMFGVVILLVFCRLFGYAELQLLKKRMGQVVLSFLQRPTPHKPHELEIHLQGSGMWRQLWTSLTGMANRLNLLTMRLDVNAPALHESYHATWSCCVDDNDESASRWRAEVPLELLGQVIGRLEISARRDGESISAKIAVLMRELQRFEGEACKILQPRRQPQVVAADLLDGP